MSEEEMKALVEMKDMLKAENTKLKQEKEKLKNKLDIANEKLDKIKETTEFDMKIWGKEDGFILINGNKLLSIIGGNDE